jgi:molybdopterin-guanine dinucleotide biosynthesis protein B
LAANPIAIPAIAAPTTGPALLPHEKALRSLRLASLCDEPRLPELLARMSAVDLVVVEGFKSEPHRKIEVHRAANGKPLLFPGDPAIAGIASDTTVETALPLAHLDDIPAVAALMERSAVSVEDVLSRSSIET